MSNVDPVVALERSPGFRGIARPTLHAVSMFCEEVQLRPGEILGKKGETPEAAWLLMSGQLEARDAAGPVASYGPGALVGHLDLLNEQSCSATWTAVTALSALAFSRESFRQLIADGRLPGSAFRRALIISLSDQLLAANGRVSEYLAANPGAIPPQRLLRDIAGDLQGTSGKAR